MSHDKPSWMQNDEEEEEEELDETNYTQSKDAVLFAIDVSASMLASPPPSNDKKADTDSPVVAALKCAHQIMQQRVISSPKDMMGVLLFGVEKTKFLDEIDSGSLAYPHCYILTDLHVPGAADIKTLKALIEDDEEAADLLQPSSEPVSMSNLLFCANQIFTTKAPNFNSRRLFIITDNDDPHSKDKASASQATVRAKDLYDLDVTIELFPISHPDHEFDRTKFYDDILYADPEEPEDIKLAHSSFKSSGGGISLLNNLISDINSKQVAKRALFSSVPLEIGPNLSISVKGYNILQQQKPARSCYVWDQGEELQVPISKSEQSADSTSKPITDKSLIKKAFKFAGTQVLFSEEDQKALKNWGTPVIRIIGFKPQSMLPPWASMKKSTFIYPSEDHYVGSTRTFSALWQKLLKDKKMGVAWHLARTNATPVLVAILPCQERVDEVTKRQISPDGLWLYQLPFADDIRTTPPVAKPLVAPDALIDEMRKIIQQMQLPKAIYDPTKYPNRNLQWHYKLLQAKALEDEVPEEIADTSIPKYRQIEKRCGEYIHNWREILEREASDHQHSLKHSAGVDDDDEEKPKKRVKVEKSATTLDAMTTDQVRKLVANGTLGKHSVQELKDFLSTKGQRATGKKADLLERVEEWLESQA